MLKINQFYWKLYKESPEGKKTIEKFEKASHASFTTDEAIALFKEYDPEWFLNLTEEETYDSFVFLSRFLSDRNWNESLSARDNAKEVMTSIVKNPPFSEESDEQKRYGDLLSCIVPLSFYLYKKDPSFFIPYLFLIRYHYLRQILMDYEIDIIEVPGKASFDKRCFYYLDICDALSKFRIHNQLTSAELCALVFDMERRHYDAAYSKKNTAFPQVWLMGGGKQGKEVTDKTIVWQGNPDTKIGDIVVFYETAKTEIVNHRKCLTGIWRALSDGIVDPLFYRYGTVIIGNEIKIKPIPFDTLNNDARSKHLPRCGAHFCGIRGDAVSTKQFNSLLDLIKEKDTSFDRKQIPELPEPINVEVEFENRGKMEPEKWVEEYRIRRMLKEMGWEGGYESEVNPETVDYIRQVHLQMGRSKIEGEKRQDGRTDFSLFPFGRWNRYKSADVLIEAKAPGEMDGRKLDEAYWQAESYASRQYAGLIILADKDRLLLFPRSNKDNVFKGPDSYIEYLWDVLFADPDKRAELKKVILGYRVHSK